MRDLDRRLARLEAQFASEEESFPEWHFEDQATDILDKLLFFRTHHADGRVTYPATDREFGVLGALYAREQLPDGVGEYEFPSGALLRWVEHEDGTSSVSRSGNVEVEDLPEYVGAVFKRMDPAEQPERDPWLYEHREWAKSERERMQRWREEQRRPEVAEKRLLGLERYLAELESAGKWWQGSPEAHAAKKEQIRAGLEALAEDGD